MKYLLLLGLLASCGPNIRVIAENACGVGYYTAYTDFKLNEKGIDAKQYIKQGVKRCQKEMEYYLLEIRK